MNPTSILIVEDEGIVAEDLANRLDRLGYKVCGVAAQGHQAIQMAQDLKPRLILMDIQLDGPIDGIQTAEIIQREHDIPVIYLTAHSDPATLARAKLTGPSGYILKPFEERELATQVELALYKHQADRQLREQREWLRVTLTSIGDAVIATDDQGRISFLNPVAEALTGWTAPEAMGRPVGEVFRIINEQTGQPVEVPVDLVLRERRTVPLANHTAIITKDGRSVPVEDSAAPIMDAAENVIGVVLVFHDVTEKRRAAEALQASEKRLRESQSKLESALNSITDAVFITDAEGRFINANDAFATYHKFRNKEECSRSFAECPNILDVWMADGQPAPPEMWAVPRALRGERVTQTEYTLRRKDTGETWVGSYSFGPIRNKDGEVSGSVVVARDITERKKMEDAVYKSEQLLRDVLDNMVAMIGLMTPDGTLILANRTSLEAANLTPEEVLGKPFEECYWWAWSSVVQERLRNAIARAAAGHVSRYDEEIRVGEGEYRTIDFMLSPMFGTDGRITYLIPSATDITDRKKVEDALHLAVERYEWQVRLFGGVADTTPDFVYLFDRQGRFQYANRRLLEVWGMTLEQVIGKTCRELGYEQWHHDMHMREIAQVIETKHPIKGEVPFKAPLTGIFGVYEYIFTPVISPDGAVELIAGTTRDISERKRMEDQLRELNESLEQKVAERTELLEARSKQLQTLAVELIEAEERERRKIAHLLHDDLQQMLAAAKMQLQAISDDLPEQVMLKNIGEIVEESLATTRRLSHELSPAVLHHSGLIEGLKWLSGQMKEQFGLETVLEGNTDKMLEGTPSKLFLFRAVQELLFNIVKHAGVKTAHIECASANSTYTVSVSDQGRGFDPMILKTYKEKLGLGLLSIRERANYFGGKVAIDSVPGEGSRFTLTVPIGLNRTEDFQIFDRGSDRKIGFPELPLVPDQAGAIRVLFADDHHVMRQGLIHLVAGQTGIQAVGEAGNGREACEQARQLQPDVILMDVSMPEMDGIEATAIIKKDQPNTRIIGLSMHEDEKTEQRMIAAGASAYISKVAPIDKIIEVIRNQQT